MTTNPDPGQSVPPDPWTHLLETPIPIPTVERHWNWISALKAADAEVKRLRDVILRRAVDEMNERQAATGGVDPVSAAIERHNQWVNDQIARDKVSIERLTQKQEDLRQLRDAEIMRAIRETRDRTAAHALLLLARRAGVRGSEQDLPEPEPHSTIGSMARFLREYASGTKSFRAPWCVFTYGAAGELLLCGTVATLEAAHQVRREVEQEHGWAGLVDVRFYGCRVEEVPK